MAQKIVVFDFDKTLINIDTTFSFFKYCISRKPILYLMLPLYFFLKVLSKLNIISVKKEKEIGLTLFCPRNIDRFENLCKEFSKTLSLNELYYNIFVPLKKKNNKLLIIASASFSIYLEKFFPGIKVIGSTLKISNNKIVGISQHPYKKEKREILLNNGISHIDEFYTDSKNDIYTSKIAKKTFWVKNGNIIKKSVNTV